MPSWAPRPVATSSAAGTARPSAHGQATTRTATAGARASASEAPATSQPTNASTAINSAAGTNQLAILSARRWTLAFSVCASSTSRAMRAAAESAPTRSVRIVRTPSVLIDPPATSSPGSTSTGMLSPVRSERSSEAVPSTIVPSAGIRSPGRTSTRSPTRSVAVGTSSSLPSCTIVAFGALKSESARTASPARRRARSSSTRPASSTAVTTAATSKVSVPVDPRAVNERCIGIEAASVSRSAATDDT